MKKIRKKNLHIQLKYVIGAIISILIISGLTYSIISKVQASQTKFKSSYTKGKNLGAASDRIIIKYKKKLTQTQKNQVLSKHTLKRKRIASTSGIETVSIPPGSTPDTIIAKLKQSEKDSIEFVEQDQLLTPDAIPNDQYFGANQWHLHTIQTPQAWDRVKGNGVIVGVCDTGFDATHPDLAPALLSDLGINTADDSTRWGVIEGANPPISNHGTMTAGTIAEITDNTIGGAGITWGAKIIPVRVTNRLEGGAYTFDLAECITYAADHGARVINLSYRVAYSPTINAAAQYAEGKGATVLVGAGNSSTNLDYYPNYDGIIAVSATDQADQLASFSDYGNYVDVAAPGVNVLTTSLNGTYGYYNGTSCSSPVASGVMALIYAAKPSITPAEAKTILFASTDDIGPKGKDIYFGNGRVNAYKAVKMVLGDTVVPTPTPTPTPIGPVPEKPQIRKLIPAQCIEPSSPKCFLYIALNHPQINNITSYEVYLNGSNTPFMTLPRILQPNFGYALSDDWYIGPIAENTKFTVTVKSIGSGGARSPASDAMTASTFSPTAITSMQIPYSYSFWISFLLGELEIDPLITDRFLKPISGAYATGTLTYPNGIKKQSSVYSDAVGQSNFKYSWIPVAKYIFTLDTIVKTGYTYEPAETTKTVDMTESIPKLTPTPTINPYMPKNPLPMTIAGVSTKNIHYFKPGCAISVKATDSLNNKDDTFSYEFYINGSSTPQEIIKREGEIVLGGSFTFIFGGANYQPNTTYTMNAVITNRLGAKSVPSNSVTFTTDPSSCH